MAVIIILHGNNMIEKYASARDPSLWLVFFIVSKMTHRIGIAITNKWSWWL